MSYHGAIWIRMNPDRDSGYDHVEECLPKVPQLQFRHAAKAPAESKYPTPPARITLLTKMIKGTKFTQVSLSLLGGIIAESAFMAV